MCWFTKFFKVCKHFIYAHTICNIFFMQAWMKMYFGDGVGSVRYIHSMLKYLREDSKNIFEIFKYITGVTEELCEFVQPQ